MSTTELIEQLKHMDNADRLAIIEAASRLVRHDLSSDQQRDHRLREKAAALKDLYEFGGKLTEWSSLDSEEIIDDSSTR
jgi:hypothetical protein